MMTDEERRVFDALASSASVSDFSEDPEKADAIVRNWAQRVGEIGANILAIDGTEVAPYNKIAMGIGTMTGMTANLRMVYSLGMEKDIDQCLYAVLRIVVGHLVDDGILTINHLPERKHVDMWQDQEDGWDINEDGTSNLRMPAPDPDDDDIEDNLDL